LGEELIYPLPASKERTIYFCRISRPAILGS